MGGYVNRTKIAQLYADAESLGGQTVTVAGWVKSVRDMKNFGFVTLNERQLLPRPAGRMNREALDTTTRSLIKTSRPHSFAPAPSS